MFTNGKKGVYYLRTQRPLASPKGAGYMLKQRLLKNMKDRYDVIIIGAGPAGLSAALYAGRAKLRTLVLDGAQEGGQIRITQDIENYPGIEKISGEAFTQSMINQAKAVGADIRLAKVKTITPGAKGLHQVITNQGTFEGVGVIVATGAVPKAAGFEGEKTYQGRGVSYCATCDGALFAGKDVFVIGGGYAAAEEAVFLTRFARKVHALVRRDEYTCSGLAAEEVLSNPKIEVHFNTQVVEVTGDELPRAIRLKNNQTGQEWTYENKEESFGVFAFVGYTPQTKWLKNIVDVDEGGYIPTGEDMQTSLKGVYAAGDVRPKGLRQLVTATSDGAVAATAAQQYIHQMKKKHNIEVLAQPKPPKRAQTTQDPQTNETTQEPEGFLAPQVVAQVKEIFAQLPKTVEIKGALGEDEFSDQLGAFLQEIGEINSKKVRVSLFKNKADQQMLGLDRMPGFVITAPGKKPLYYYILPAGHEFQSFILALEQMAGLEQDFAKEVMEKLLGLTKPIKVQVGVTLTCPMCPPVVQGMQALAAKAPFIDLEIIDVQYYPDFQQKHNVMSVPIMVVNDEKTYLGRTDVLGLIERLEEAQAA